MTRILHALSLLARGAAVAWLLVYCITLQIGDFVIALAAGTISVGLGIVLGLSAVRRRTEMVK